MDGLFDLFGHPVSSGTGSRGRPPYQPTEEDRNRVKLLLALGWSLPRIANAVGRSKATISRYFRGELKQRDAMRDRMEAARIEKAWQLSMAGNVGAMKEYDRLLERNDRMEAEREMGLRPKPKDEQAAERVGKKIVDAHRAIDADAELMAELELEAAGNASASSH